MVAIKDMEMPKCCFDCSVRNYCDAEGNKCDLTELLKIENCCPLVEIITCKDCQYYRPDDDTGYCTNHTCGDIKFWCYDDYYCADAKMKGGENETN